MTPEEAVGQQVARARGRLGLTQQALADAIAQHAPDTTLNRAAVAKIESGVRRVGLDELVLLAVALDVPPVLLLLPVEHGEDVQLAPGREVGAWTAFEWMIGRRSLSDRAAWITHTHLVRLYDQLLDAQERARTASYRVNSADALGRNVERFIEDMTDALVDLATAMRDFESFGGDPRSVVDRRMLTAIRKAKIEPREPRTVNVGAGQED